MTEKAARAASADEATVGQRDEIQQVAESLKDEARQTRMAAEADRQARLKEATEMSREHAVHFAA